MIITSENKTDAWEEDEYPLARFKQSDNVEKLPSQ